MVRPERKTLVDDAYERLKEEILENRMPPGFQAPEPEIAHRMGMSRTPVREALLRLESDGLVELIPRRGVRVLPLSPNDMREIYEVLAILEPEAAAKLAEADLDESALRELELVTEQMEAACEKGDLEAWAAADNDFHRKLLALHGNKRMMGFIQTIYAQAHRARMITLRLREKPQRSTEEHRQVMTYIREGNADKAREAFRHHRERSAAELLQILENLRLHSV